MFQFRCFRLAIFTLRLREADDLGHHVHEHEHRRRPCYALDDALKVANRCAGSEVLISLKEIVSAMLSLLKWSLHC